MKANGGIGNGMIVCEEAFQRLVNGAPVVSQHVGLDSSKITAGIVSVEAGFDRGYLKKSRKNHQPLIARIEAYRAEAASIKATRSPTVHAIKRVQDKLSVLEDELKVVYQQRDVVLTQNLQLYERVRELEQEIARLLPRLGHSLRSEVH